MPGRAWVFEQMLGVFYVHVPIRMSVIAMDAGGLFVYAPVAPTAECLALLRPLISKYGAIKHMLLPSVAPEHKVLAGPFAKNFPEAQLWTTDRQYAFPLNLPGTWLGLPSNAKFLSEASSQGGAQPFGPEFEYEILTAKASASSVYQDAAVYHKPSKTMLVCDAIQSISAEPPPILLSEPEYRRALLYHARDDPLEKVADTPEVWRKGWQRIALFATFFMPGPLIKLETNQWLSAAPKSPMPELGWAGVLPFTWSDATPVSFEALSAGGRPTVAPIIQIILSRSPTASRDWVEKICSWDFERVLPCHFDAPIEVRGAKLRESYAFLQKGTNSVPYCDADVAFLRDALDGLPPDLALFPTPLGSLRGTACTPGASAGSA